MRPPLLRWFLGIWVVGLMNNFSGWQGATIVVVDWTGMDSAMLGPEDVVLLRLSKT